MGEEVTPQAILPSLTRTQVRIRVPAAHEELLAQLGRSRAGAGMNVNLAVLIPGQIESSREREESAVGSRLAGR
jgi:hypothetical protein